MSNFHLVITYNKLFKDMAFCCLSSIKNKNFIIHFNYNQIDENISGFGSESWYKCIDKKNRFTAELFDSLENGEFLCVSDCDIFYFDSDHTYSLQDYMNQNNLHIIGLAEHGDIYPEGRFSAMINGGFFIIKKTQRTQNFFKQILKEDIRQHKHADQNVINQILKTQNINYELLDTSKYTSGCYVYHNLENSNKIQLLHATCCENLEEKTRLINDILKHYNMPPLEKMNITISDKKIHFYKNGQLQHKQTN